MAPHTGRSNGKAGRHIDRAAPLGWCPAVRRMDSSPPRTGCGGCVLVPKLFYNSKIIRAAIRRGCDRGRHRRDRGAPAGHRLAIASGVSPERGLYTAIVAGFPYPPRSAGHASRSRTHGRVVDRIRDRPAHGVDGLIVATIMAGALRRVGSRGGSEARSSSFLPRDGRLHQRDRGLCLPGRSQICSPAARGGARGLIGKERRTLHTFTRLTSRRSPAAGTLAILILWPRFNWRVPSAIVAPAATAVVQLFGPVETIGTGSVRSKRVAAAVDATDRLSMIRDLIGPRSPSPLGAIESSLSAVIADGSDRRPTPVQHGAGRPGDRERRRRSSAGSGDRRH